MAVNDLPNYLKLVQGTAIVWGEAGGSGVTATLSFDALGIGSCIQGNKVDLGAEFEEGYWVHFLAETGGTGPTTGAAYAWLACSQDNSTFPGKVTGSAGSYTRGSGDVNLALLGMQAAWIPATLAADANVVLYSAPSLWFPTGRYVAPVIANDWNQAFRDQATASNNASRLILVPRTLKLID